MKRFFSLSALVALVASILILGADQSLTANDPVIGSFAQPIKVVGLKFAQDVSKSKQKASWLDGLEVQIENTSDKPIQYLVMHVEIPVGPSATDLVKVPISYGRALSVDSKAGKLDMFQPKTELILRASKETCERVRKQLAASERVPSPKDVHTNLHVAIFENRTAWLAGRLHFPDPTDSKRWLAAEELARSQSQVNRLFGMSFSKVSFKPASKSQPCYRYTGFTWQYCCTEFPSRPEYDPPYDIYVGSANFAEDPTGNVHPNTTQACCSQSSSGCCDYDEIGLGCN